MNYEFLFKTDYGIKELLEFIPSRKIAHNLISELHEFEENLGKRLFCLNDLIALVVCYDLKTKGVLGTEHFKGLLEFLKHKPNCHEKDLPVVIALNKKASVLIGKIKDGGIEWTMDDSALTDESIFVIQLPRIIQSVLENFKIDIAVGKSEFLIVFENHLSHLDRVIKFAENNDCEINLKSKNSEFSEIRIKGPKQVMALAEDYFSSTSAVRELIIN